MLIHCMLVCTYACVECSLAWCRALPVAEAAAHLSVSQAVRPRVSGHVARPAASQAVRLAALAGTQQGAGIRLG